jgi:hypothetical protein
MKWKDHFWRFCARFRYPVSLPEDISEALGIPLSNFISFDQLVGKIGSTLPTKLSKFMSREEAEAAFSGATCKEKFYDNTVCSFCFTQGRIVFVLKFDEQNRLRRIYLQHKLIRSDQGVEIPLQWEPSKAPMGLSTYTGSAVSIKG